MEPSIAVAELEVVDRGSWRLVVSSERFEREWFGENSEGGVLYHFNPEEKSLSVHFRSGQSLDALVPEGLEKLAQGLAGKHSGRKLALLGFDTREAAVLMSEYLQEYFDGNRKAHDTQKRAAR